VDSYESINFFVGDLQTGRLTKVRIQDFQHMNFWHAGHGKRCSVVELE
jgi:hypothetical protein